jgi:hypothetical protein
LKVVLDTNVLISGIFFTGPPRTVLEAWIDGRIDVVASLEILDEYRCVLGELSGRFPEVDASGRMDFLTVPGRNQEQPGPPKSNNGRGFRLRVVAPGCSWYGVDW